MINDVGAFFSIWLVLWLILSVSFVLAYPLLRASLLGLHPRYSSNLLLLYWSAPLLGSLLVALFLFSPMVEEFLVSSHCHSACESHVPQIGSKGLAWFGLVVGSVVVLFLLGRTLATVLSAYRLDRQFSNLGKYRGDHFAISSSCPLVFTLGWWNPRIFVSDGLAEACTDTDLSIILMHEQAHKRRRDNLRLLFARLATALLSGKLAKRVFADIQLATEQACDFYAAEKHGHIAVAETLLKIKRLLMERSQITLKGAVSFADSSIENRVLALLKADEKVALNSWQISLLLLTGVGILMASIAPLHHGAEWIVAFVTGAH